MLYGLFWGNKALVEYQEYADEVFKDFLNDDYLKDCSFDDTVALLMTRFEVLLPRLGTRCNEEADKMLVSLCMDMDGKPTSEMGHLMVKLASYPETQETKTSDEFLMRLQDQTYPTEFTRAYS